MDPVSNYCPELWQRMFLHQTNRTFVAKPCCYYQEPDQPLWISQADKIFNTYNQSAKIRLLREENQQGKLGPGCKVCAHAEQVGMESGRLSALKRLSDQNRVVPTRHLDLNLGNLCNLACAICDPHSSTSWIPIYQAMEDKSWPYPTYNKYNRPVIDDAELFENLETIQLQGGEVFLQAAYADFFRNLSRHRDLGEITVVIFTNGTVLPSVELWDSLICCRQVDLYFSIDDIDKRFEYQRHGAKWHRVISNIRWFQDHARSNIQLGFHPTYSLLNIFYLIDLRDFLQQEFPDLPRRWGPYHVGTGPCIADAMPKVLRDAVITKNQGVEELDFIGSYVREEQRNLAPFFEYISKYDRATQGSYAQTHAEFWTLLTAIDQ